MIRIAGNMLVGAWLAAAAVAGAAELKGSITDADGLALPGANIPVTGGGLDRAFLLGERDPAATGHGLAHVEAHVGERLLGETATDDPVAHTRVTQRAADLDVLLGLDRTDVDDDARAHLGELLLEVFEQDLVD